MMPRIYSWAEVRLFHVVLLWYTDFHGGNLHCEVGALRACFCEGWFIFWISGAAPGFCLLGSLACTVVLEVLLSLCSASTYPSIMPDMQ
jgi:hypothetical protein